MKHDSGTIPFRKLLNDSELWRTELEEYCVVMIAGKTSVHESGLMGGDVCVDRKPAPASFLLNGEPICSPVYFLGQGAEHGGRSAQQGVRLRSRSRSRGRGDKGGRGRGGKAKFRADGTRETTDFGNYSCEDFYKGFAL